MEIDGEPGRERCLISGTSAHTGAGSEAPASMSGAGVEADSIGAAQHELQSLSKVIADALWAIQQQRDPAGAAAAGESAAMRVNDAAAALDACLAAIPDYELDAAAVVARLAALEATYGARADAAGARAAAALAERVQSAQRAMEALAPASIAADVAAARAARPPSAATPRP